jgi:hypothetical protein
MAARGDYLDEGRPWDEPGSWAGRLRSGRSAPPGQEQAGLAQGCTKPRVSAEWIEDRRMEDEESEPGLAAAGLDGCEGVVVSIEHHEEDDFRHADGAMTLGGVGGVAEMPEGGVGVAVEQASRLGSIVRVGPPSAGAQTSTRCAAVVERSPRPALHTARPKRDRQNVGSSSRVWRNCASASSVRPRWNRANPLLSLTTGERGSRPTAWSSTT